eukprot:1731818-Pleurochrysis_carterae.AAC.3
MAWIKHLIRSKTKNHASQSECVSFRVLPEAGTKPAPAAMAPKTGDRSLLVAACLLSSLQMEWLLFALSLVLTRESAREPFESSREFAERRFEPRGRCHRRPGDPLTLPRLWPCGPVSLSVNGRKGSKMAVEKRKLCCCCCSSKRLFSAICSCTAESEIGGNMAGKREIWREAGKYGATGGCGLR